MKKEKFNLTQPDWAGFSSRAKNYLTIYRFSLIFAFLLFVSIIPVSAQPATSFATGNVSVSFEDCVARARQALELEGYGGLTRAGDKYFGFKGIHTAIIICDKNEVNSQRDFHVVVASIANTGDIPGLERINLGNRMGIPATGKTEGGGGSGPNYQGCWKDGGPDRDLGQIIWVTGDMTIERCTAKCKENGYSFAGLQNSSACMCGNSYGRYGKADNCNMKCNGNPGQICGGDWANSVYKVW